MSDKTGIQWTDATWNPSIGCRRVSRGCEACYAEKQAKRIVAMSRGRGERSPYEDVVQMVKSPVSGELNPKARWNGRAVFLPGRLDQPLRWKRPRRVFVNSMSDLFHEDLTFEQIAAVFGVMAACPRHTFQVLTKRPARALEFFEWIDQHTVGWRGSAVDELGWQHGPQTIAAVSYSMKFLEKPRIVQLDPPWPLPNVWLGVSAEDQATADERIPLLLRCPAAVRFVSAEPLLEPIRFGDVPEIHIRTVDGVTEFSPRLDWVIVGGESGPGARPCDVGWVRSIVEQCHDAGVACFVKQLGANVRDRNDAGFLGEEDDAWDIDDITCVEHNPNGFREEHQGAPVRVRLTDRKGGKADEWPEDLRVREFPEVSP